MKKWERELIEREGWEKVRDGLEVKLCKGPEGTENFILCRSADRMQKEKAMHERFAQRIRAGMQSLSRRLARNRKVDRVQVERQIGRLLGRNSRAAGQFEVHVVEEPSHKSGVRLDWRERDEWSEWASLVEGTYILRSNVEQWTERELWQTYIQLTQAEAAFRIHKSDLRIRPIWHQKQERVQAHVLVCFLAFAMWKTLEGWQSRAGLGNSPRTMLEELGRIQVVDVVLPVVGGPDLRLRCVAQPDGAQAALLERLGLALDKRLRHPRGPQM
jgi:transposase